MGLGGEGRGGRGWEGNRSQEGGVCEGKEGGRRVELRNERLGSTDCLWSLSLLIVLLLLLCLHVYGYTLLFT